jgi:hypothetical protein
MAEDEDLELSTPTNRPDFTLRQKSSGSTPTNRKYQQAKRSYTIAFKNSYTVKIDEAFRQMAKKRATKALIVGTTLSCTAALFASWAIMKKYNIKQATDIPAVIQKHVGWHMENSLSGVVSFIVLCIYILCVTPSSSQLLYVTFYN